MRTGRPLMEAGPRGSLSGRSAPQFWADKARATGSIIMSESDIADWLATQQDAMVAMLRDMVTIDSGSYNKAGIDAVGDVVRRFMAGQTIPIETVAQQKHGDCLRAVAPWDGPANSRHA